MHIKVITVGVASVFLSSCAMMQGPDIPAYRYSNPNIPAEQKIAQWAIDKAECKGKALQVPIPPDRPCYGDGFAFGFCRGENIKSRNNALEAQQEVYHGCLLGKGYKARLAEQ